MDIAAISLVNSQTQVQTASDVLVLKKAMNTVQQNSLQMISDIMVPPSSTTGLQVDIRI